MADEDQGIDPRLRDAIQSTQAFQSYSPPAFDQSSNSIRLPPPTTHAQPAQQPHYAPWPPNGYNPYYGPPPDQQSLSLQPPNGYQPYQAVSAAPVLPPTHSGSAESTKRLRACEACRGLKVRCEPDPNGGACKRCLKAGRSCLITEPTRKRQKKSDSRVFELEKKLEALTATLQAARDGQNQSDDDNMVGEDTSHLSSLNDIRIPSPLHQGHYTQRQPYAGYQQLAAYANMSTAGRKRSNSEYQETDSRNALDRPTSLTKQEDTSGHNDVDEAIVIGLVDQFVNNLQTCIPVVKLPNSASAEALRQSRPNLRLAVLSAASRQGHHLTLHKKMTHDITKILADRAIVKGEKSLELIQAFQIVAVWCWRADAYDGSLPLPLVQLAATMAMELSLDLHASEPLGMPAGMDITLHQMESARAWLGCYLLCSIATMDLEQYSTVRFTTRIEGCLEVIEKGDPLASDEVLCDLVRLQKLADDFITHVAPDALATSSSTKIHNAYTEFERKLQLWEKQTPNRSNPSLSLGYRVIKLYMHEIAQCAGSPTPRSDVSKGKGQSLSSLSSKIDPRATVTMLAIGVLDAFLELSINNIQSLPAYQYFHVAHAGISLIKNHLTMTSPDAEINESQVSDSIIDERLDRILTLLREARPGAAAPDIKIEGAQHSSSVEQRLYHSIGIDQTEQAAHSSELARSLEGLFCLLQIKWQHVKAQATGGSTATQDTSETANRALLLLSEVAMGNTGQSGENPPPRAESPSKRASAEVVLERLFQEGEHVLVKDKMIANVFQQLARAGKT